MNKNYKLLSTARRPFRLGSESMTTIYVYDVEPDTYSFLMEVDCFEREGYFHGDRDYAPEVWETGTLRNAVMNDLELAETGIAVQGAQTYRYDFALIGGCLILAEHFSYNT